MRRALKGCIKRALGWNPAGPANQRAKVAASVNRFGLPGAWATPDASPLGSSLMRVPPARHASPVLSLEVQLQQQLKV